MNTLSLEGLVILVVLNSPMEVASEYKVKEIVPEFEPYEIDFDF